MFFDTSLTLSVLGTQKPFCWVILVTYDMLQQGLCEYLITSHLTANSLCHSCFVQEIKSRSATTENHLRQVRHRRRVQVMPQLPHLNFFSSQFLKPGPELISSWTQIESGRFFFCCCRAFCPNDNFLLEITSREIV